MKLSESKATRGAITYYLITEGGRMGSKMLMHHYGEGGRGLAL